jgi:hypothetical protein
MLRRLALLLPALLAIAAACGEDTTVAGAPPSSTASIEHTSGASEVVLQLSSAGGFVPVDFDFARLPSLTIYGDGTVIEPGAVPAIYPGPLVPPLSQRTITEVGLQKVLAAAQAAGLLAPAPSYDSPAANQVADAPSTELVVHAAGGTWTHDAYALVEADADTPARAKLAEFVRQLGDLGALAGADQIGPEQPYEVAQYRIKAQPDPSEPVDDPPLEPTVRAWPGTIDLAAAAQCAVVDAPSTTPAFAGANQLTWFEQASTTYALVVRPLLPGEAGC